MCFVLEPADPSVTEVLRIACSSFDFEEQYNFIYETWEAAQYDNIERLLSRTKRKDNGKKGLRNSMKLD